MKLQNIDIEERIVHYNIPGLSFTLIENFQISKAECYGLLEDGTTRKVDSSSIFNACSVSKFLTSMLVIKLSEQGILNIDEDVNKVLLTWKVPDTGFTKNTKVTLRNLLSHQSGIVDPDGSFNVFNIIDGTPSIVEILEGRTPYNNIPIEVRYEPESDFQYSDAGFCVIQQVLEDVTKKSFKELVNDFIFEPLKMKNSSLEYTLSETIRADFSCGHNKNGERVNGKYPIYPYPAASGLWTTPSDLAILVIDLMNSLKGKSEIGISKKQAKTMFTSQGCMKWTGLGIFLDRVDKEIEISSLGWGVGFQCMMVAYPYLGAGLVIMINSDLGVHQLKGIIGEVYHSLSLSK